MSKILYEKKGKIAYVTLNRPKVNAIDFEMTRQLAEIWVDFRDDDALDVAVLTGVGNVFSVGFDVSLMPTLTTGNYTGKESSVFGDNRFSPIAFSVWKPVIVALNGVANGAGVWLAAGCDIRIAAREVSFGVGEVKLGFPTELSAFLTRYMPQAIVNELLLGYTISAERAYEVGFVNRVVPREELMSEAEAMANTICNENGPLAMRAQKELIFRSWDLDYTSAEALSRRMAPPIINSEDAKEGVNAFLEKRKPVWKGK